MVSFTDEIFNGRLHFCVVYMEIVYSKSEFCIVNHGMKKRSHKKTQQNKGQMRKRRKLYLSKKNLIQKILRDRCFRMNFATSFNTFDINVRAIAYACRISRLRMFFKIGVPKNFKIFKNTFLPRMSASVNRLRATRTNSKA